VANVNKLPDAVDDTFIVDENTALTGTLLGNDDLGDEATTVTDFDNVSDNGAAVTVDAQGNFTYTPVTDFDGADTFTYTITDADGDESTATVTVNVSNVNKLPDAVDDGFEMDENTQLTGTLLGNDDLGDEATTVTEFDNTSVNGATVTVDAAGNFVYTPVTDFTGEDTFTYTITDADGDESTATVTVDVANVNKLPEAVDDSFIIDENTSLNNNVIGNDELGDPLTTVTPFDITAASGRTVSMDANGNFTYTPAANFTGTDTFNYTITDADGDTSTATVTVIVEDVPVTPPDLLPNAVDDTYAISENTTLNRNVLGNDNLGDQATAATPFTVITDSGGTGEMEANGNFRYEPAPNFVGTETFAYTITDADGDVSSADITVTVSAPPENIPPVAIDDSFSLSEGDTISDNVISNTGGTDTDGGDGAGLSVTHVTVNSITTNVAEVGNTDVAIEGGTLSISANGNFTYTNSEGFDFDPVTPSTQPSFEYTLSDGIDTATATVSITINDSAPVANDDSKSIVLEGDILSGADSVTVSGNIIAGGTAGDGDVADTSADGTVTLVSVEGQSFVDSVTPIVITTGFGQLSILSSGAYSYVSKDGIAIPDDAVTDTFSYVIEDGDANQNESDTASLTINLTPSILNIPPVAEDDSFSLSEGDTISDNVILNSGGTDTDGGDGAALSVTHVDGNPISGEAIFTIIDGVLNEVAVSPLDDAIFIGTNDNGILTINENGQFTYENKGFLEGSPAPTFEYTLSDGTDTDTAEVTINVNTNAPEAVADTNYVLFTAFLGSVVAPQIVGNVVTGQSTGDRADSPGSDGFGTPILTQVLYAGTPYNLDANPPATPLEITTDYGTLVIDNMGAYTFMPATIEIGDPRLSPDKLSANDTVDLEFTYTLQDSDILDPETDFAILTIEISAPFVEPVAPESLSIDIDFNQTGGTIDTDFDAKAFLNVEDPAAKYSPDLDDLSDILTDEHAGGLENYLAVMSKDDGAITEDAVVLEKGEADLEPESFATVTNGLLADGAILVSDVTAANAPIAELDSADLL
jgi:hypothetical protein